MKRKNILKEAGVLFIATILVLTSIVTIPMTMAQPLPHDVGVKEIISPTSGCNNIYPVKVLVNNSGDNTEVTDVQVEITPEGGPVEYVALVEDVVVLDGQEKVVNFSDWTPKQICVNYTITAWTLLDDDNPKNDCTYIKIFIGTVDIEIINIWAASISPAYPKFKVVKAEIKNNGCMDCCPINWSFNFTGKKIISGPRSGHTPISAYGTVTIPSDLVIGFAWTGTVNVTVNDTCCNSSDTETKNVRIFYFLRKVLP